MKKKFALCFLVFALLVTCASATGTQKKVDAVSAESGSGATVEKGDTDRTVKVSYAGEKDKQYVVMAVDPDIVGASGVPTKTDIANHQDGVVYMDQVTGDSSTGNVEFVVHPNLEKSEKGDSYYIYISSNVSNPADAAMKKVGSFTIDELIEVVRRFLGDLNGDKDITIADVQILLNYVIDNTRLTGDDLTAANVNKDEAKDITIADVQLLLNHVIDNAPKEAIA